jgi:predicted N-acyltransferase
LLAAALELAKDCSSLHVLFPEEDEARLMQAQGMHLRRTVQFHWRNEGYTDFDSFLARLSHARRKNIRQERRRVREAGVELRWIAGENLTSGDWEFFNRCYRGTYAAHGSSPYLNLDFFRRLGAALPHHVAMVVAEGEARPIAGALFLYDEEALYGRYWGALEHVPLLHFECCYYQAIEFAIGRGLQRFEGGAQGEHKLFRGLLPVESLSAHWLAHPSFSRAVEDFLEREEGRVARYVNELCEHSPFKSEGA